MSTLVYNLAALAVYALAILAMLLPGLASADEVRRVWLDTDAACGTGARRDVDDCLAIALLADPRIELIGISTIFGNAPRRDVDVVVAEALKRWPGRPPPVYAGFDGTAAREPVPPAVTALADAIEAGPLTLLALGPLTNIAAALRDAAVRRQNILRIVAVMGRRPGHVFHPSNGVDGGILFGHGPVFSDFNVEQDAGAVRTVLASNVPLDLVPYESASAIVFGPAELKRLANASPLGAWAVAHSEDWLLFWQRDIGRNGFFPFDLLAAARLVAPSSFRCEGIRATYHAFGPVGYTGLLLGGTLHSASASGTVRWCRADDSMTAEGLARLAVPFVLD